MPKQQNNRIKPNLSGRTNITRAAPGVQAAPVNRTITPEVSGASQLAYALGQISPSFNKYLSDKHNKFVEDETARGTQAASLSKKEVDKKIAKGEIQPEQSPYFQKAYMKQAGINAGIRRAHDLQVAYADPEQFNIETGDINEFINSFLTSDTDGIVDSDYKEGFLKAIRSTEGDVRQKHTNLKVSEVREDVQNQVYQSYLNAFDLMAKSGSDDAANLEQLSQNARDLNVSNKELNSIAFKAASTYAMQDEGHPEVFDLFKNKGRNGVASLFYTADYGKQIEAAQRQASSVSSAKKATLNNQTKFKSENNWIKTVRDSGGVIDLANLSKDIFDKESNPSGTITGEQARRIQKVAEDIRTGDLKASKKDMYFSFIDRAESGVETYESLEAEVRASELSIGESNTILKKFIDEQDRTRKQETIREAIEANRPDLIHSMSTADKEAYAQSRLDEEFSRSKDLNVAIIRSLDDMKSSGVMPPQISSMLTTATPSNLTTWEPAVNTYRMLKEQSSTYLNQTFTNSGQIAKFESFIALTEFGGIPSDRAAETISNMNKDDIEAGNAEFAKSGMNKKISENLTDEFEGGAQFGEIQLQVHELIKLRLQMPDHPELTEELINETIERVKTRHVNVGDTWISREVKNAAIDGLDDAVSEHLGEYYKRQNPDVLIEAAKLIPDSHTHVDGTWIALDRNGVIMPGRINPDELTTAYKISNGDILSQYAAERQGHQFRYETIRKEIDELDSNNDALASYTATGRDDSRYKQNLAKREELVDQLNAIATQMQPLNGRILTQDDATLIQDEVATIKEELPKE